MWCNKYYTILCHTICIFIYTIYRVAGGSLSNDFPLMIVFGFFHGSSCMEYIYVYECCMRAASSGYLVTVEKWLMSSRSYL